MARRKRKHSIEKIFGALWYVFAELFYYMRVWLRFLWRLPPWVKQLAVILTVCWVIFQGVPNWWAFYQERKGIYDYYYGYYYKEYSKSYTKEAAEELADYYSAFYADYYTSKAYKEALANALPSSKDKKALSYDPKAPAASHVTNNLGIALIKHFEGFRDEPYLDAGGKLTIGYGHLVRQGEVFVNTSKAEMEKLLREDVKIAEAMVKRLVKVPLNSNQFAALVSLTYNIGGGAFKESTLLEELNKGDYKAAANEFLRWDKVDGERLRGLKVRRQAERKLFLT